MSKEIDGEVLFTQEEVEQAKVDAQSEVEEKISELEQASQEEKENLQRELDEAKEKLSKAESKELNFKKLRDKTDGKEVEVESLKTKVTETEKKIDEILSVQSNEVRNDFLSTHQLDPVADKDLIDKMDFYYKKTGSSAKTKDEIKVALRESYILATSTESSFNPVKPVSPGFVRGNSPAAPTSQAIEMQHSLGISDEDKKKYDPSKPMKLF